MNKSQISSGIVVNTIKKNEGRTSLEITNTNGSITYESPSNFKYSDLELKGDSFKIGYDSKTKFGHFSGSYNSQNLNSTYKITLPSCNSGNSNYDIEEKNKVSNITGILSGEINSDHFIAGGLSMITDKYDIDRVDTASSGCVWISTSTQVRNFNGSASLEYNTLFVVGKKKVKEISIGYVFSPNSSDNTRFSNDYSNSTYRSGNGNIIGFAIGKENIDANYEVGILIENSNKDSGDGDLKKTFLFYEKSLGDSFFSINYSIIEEDKVVDGSEKISRGSTGNIINLEGQFEIDDNFFLSGSLDINNYEYKKYGDYSSDLVRPNKLNSNTIGIEANILF